MATTNWNVKNIDKEIVDRFNAVKESLGFSNQIETIDFLLKHYESTVNVRDHKKNEPLLNAQTKLSQIWKAIKKHNMNELRKPKKDGEKNYILFHNQLFINKQTGANRARDIKPFLNSIETEYEEHLNALFIDKKYKMTNKVTKEDENGRSIMFQNILSENGLNDLFKSRK